MLSRYGQRRSASCCLRTGAYAVLVLLCLSFPGPGAVSGTRAGDSGPALPTSPASCSDPAGTRDPIDPHDAPLGGGFDPGKASFRLRFLGMESPYRVISAFVLPSADLRIEAAADRRGGPFLASADAGSIRALGPRTWSWHVPEEPGLHVLRISDPATGDAILLNGFVLVPYRGETVLNGYRIGRYVDRPRILGAPAHPAGFVELDPRDESTLVSPHFRLGQFACKQASGYPKYLALRTELLLKLEILLEQANRSGIRADSFAVMSGFRTPYYNAAIGNRTRESRHLYGAAADIYIDQDGDGRIDDLDHDGRITIADADVLGHLVDALFEEPRFASLCGGLGLYGARPNHGPFIHVDVRAQRARWRA